MWGAAVQLYGLRSARNAGIDAKVKAWSPEWGEGFKRDKVASQMMGAWLGGHLNNWLAPDSKGKWRSAQLPNGAFASWGGSFYAIPQKAQNKAAAWEFIKFMTTSKEMQIEAFRKLDAFPALVEAQSDPLVATWPAYDAVPIAPLVPWLVYAPL